MSLQHLTGQSGSPRVADTVTTGLDTGGLYEATIVTDAASVADDVFVVIDELDGDLLASDRKDVGPCAGWTPQADDTGALVYPAAGDRCVVQTSTSGETWIVSWQNSTGAAGVGGTGGGGGGGATPTVVNVNTNTTISAADTVVLVTGGVTVTLPASPTAGEWHDVKDAAGTASASPITLAAGGTAHIDGASTVQLTTSWQSLRVISNGTDWFIT